MTSATLQPTDLATSAILLMANGSLADFEAVIHPEARTREAFADVCWEIEQVVTHGDLVVLDATMCGRSASTSKSGNTDSNCH